MKAFRVHGSYRAEKRRNQPFSVDIVATDEEGATEKILSTFGSKHRVTRRFILVDNITEINPADSTAPTVVAHFGSTEKSAPASKTEEE